MRLSQRGLDLITSHEGLRLQTYDDLNPNGSPQHPHEVIGTLTIGYGHTGPDVILGRRITREQALHILRQDVRRFEEGVNRLVRVPLNQNQFDALVSFAFNCGLDEDADNIAEGLGDSTLLRKLNSGDYEGAAQEFPKWIRSGGRVLPGLIRRRADEQRLFMEGIVEPQHPPAAVDEGNETPRNISPVPVVVEHEDVNQSGSVNAARAAAGAGAAVTVAQETDLAQIADQASQAVTWVHYAQTYGPWLVLAVVVGAWLYIEWRRRKQIREAKR